MGRIFRFGKGNDNSRYGEDQEDQGMKPPEPDTVIHSSPWPEWFAGQDGRSVLICDKTSDKRITVEPPAAWGNAWAWNVTEDGTGIVMRRTA